MNHKRAMSEIILTSNFSRDRKKEKMDGSIFQKKNEPFHLINKKGEKKTGSHYS